ncbi:hypothetical protein GCM10017044_14540 [Kordiimonas sediminis]|uniref:Uncharacterized protein n=1 Tax=Kordiimonas sediminis TaxID=1735581 RepID=A0A919E5A0_9PROT|nr:hypothetical protein [Kordiimonas sediminis]GHF20723.1 hypothetical protein GCM10017044_14540 [Kordiimonas sediminis]
MSKYIGKKQQLLLERIDKSLSVAALAFLLFFQQLVHVSAANAANDPFATDASGRPLSIAFICGAALGEDTPNGAMDCMSCTYGESADTPADPLLSDCPDLHSVADPLARHTEAAPTVPDTRSDAVRAPPTAF